MNSHAGYLRVYALTIVLCNLEHRRGDIMPSSDVNFKIQDEGRLAELGYTQELAREWSLLHNFGASFSIIVRGRHIDGHVGIADWCLRFRV